MPRILTCLILLLLPLTASAAPPAKTLPESDPKYLVVRTVFDRLARVVGGVPPQFYLVKAIKPITTAFGPDPLIPVRVEQGKFIAMDERLVDLADELGSSQERDNALAFLLGHEMAHYAARQSGGLAGDGNNAADNVKAEEFADRMGSWYASEAGYEPFPAAQQILPKVYKEYHNGNPKLKGYPTLAKRIEIITGVHDQLAAKLPFLDAAATLLAIGRPYEAGRLYEHIARSYESRETLNNAAVANALAALSVQPRSPYFYPFELETAYRFRARSKGMGEDQETLRLSLLTKSANLLDQALFIDKTYATSQLNRAAVAELQGDAETMEYHLSQAIKLARSSADLQTQARIAILRGIVLAKGGKRAAAAELFTEARPHAEQMALTNLLAIGADPELPPPPFIPEDPVVETVSGAAPNRPGDAVKIITTQPLLLNDEYGGNITINRAATAEWHGTRLQMGRLVLTAIATPEHYAIASKRGVRLGDSDAAVTGRYGRPNRIIATRQGNMLVFSQDSIIFTIDREQKVSGWTIFSVEEK